jgi:hypothetical protein
MTERWIEPKPHWPVDFGKLVPLRGSVNPTDYEVPGLTSDGRHFFWILGLVHVMTWFTLGVAFVGAACRSLTATSVKDA